MKPTPRRKAREIAVQAVYSWQLTNNDISEVEANFLADNAKRRFDTEYFSLLLRGVATNVNDIDDIIRPLVDRPLADVDHVEKAIIRVGIFELRDCKEVPYKVVINEAIELAKAFAADDSHKFVNGVLDKVVKTFRPDE
ncbi:transcription antitermination factor NusB [Thalassotalea sp. ND16A]|uniref:transcription antitermination factor NusB n=1 Tax=Thalassotalea sp. ND16A TaxID=1535422 RepID=UPI00051A6817|nr:transcription antitermination factor NusB [Thalassotalea sp. ND16A]KGJ90279.1 hypothetical protein ND16A_2009 [Thalassotalea sp. ND16A]